MCSPAREVLSSWLGRLWRRSSIVDRRPWPSARRVGVSVCRCVGVILLCDTSVGGRPDKKCCTPPPSPADRFGRLQATGYRHEEGFLRCERLPTGCIVAISVPVPVPISGFPGFLSIVQQRPVSKPERLLEPLALCCVFLPRHETRDTRHEMRNAKCELKKHENQKQRTKNPKFKNPRTKEPKNPKIKNPRNPRTQEPKNPRIQNQKTQNQ